jgi:hypothetical protein
MGSKVQGCVYESVDTVELVIWQLGQSAIAYQNLCIGAIGRVGMEVPVRNLC